MADSKIEALALEIGTLGMSDLALKVSAGVYGIGPFYDNELLYALGSAAGRSGDLDVATMAMALANRIIAGEFDAKPASADTTNYASPWGEIEVGDQVEKISGYTFPGVVVTAYRTLAGDRRYVVECIAPGVEGCQHIFNRSQLVLKEKGRKP